MTNCITCQYREVASFVAHRITILKHVHLLRGVSTANIYRSRYNIGFFTVGGQTAEFSVGKKKQVSVTLSPIIMVQWKITPNERKLILETHPFSTEP